MGREVPVFRPAVFSDDSVLGEVLAPEHFGEEATSSVSPGGRQGSPSPLRSRRRRLPVKSPWWCTGPA